MEESCGGTCDIHFTPMASLHFSEKYLCDLILDWSFVEHNQSPRFLKLVTWSSKIKALRSPTLEAEAEKFRYNHMA